MLKQYRKISIDDLAKEMILSKDRLHNGKVNYHSSKPTLEVIEICKSNCVDDNNFINSKLGVIANDNKKIKCIYNI